jgi:hypothetical protein
MGLEIDPEDMMVAHRIVAWLRARAEFTPADNLASLAGGADAAPGDALLQACAGALLAALQGSEQLRDLPPVRTATILAAIRRGSIARGVVPSPQGVAHLLRRHPVLLGCTEAPRLAS